MKNIQSIVYANLPKTVIEMHKVINKTITKTNADETF